MKDLSNIFIKSLLITVVFFLFGTGALHAADIKVCETCPTKTIAAAIKQAHSGDRILLQPGNYHEYGLEIDKPISLIGIDKPVVDGKNNGEILRITSNNVTVDGITFKNIETSYMKDNAAIRVYESRNVTITNNNIIDSFFGIYLQNSVSCFIKNNTIKGQSKMESSSGNAIHLWYCDDVLIENNYLSGHRDGIYLEFVKDSEIHHNISENNLRYGLHFMFSDGNVYTYNTFRKNGAGVAVMYTKNIRMEHNRFEHNWGSAAYGLLLKDISRSIISNNYFVRNTIGIYMEGSSKLDVDKNYFASNGWAIKLLSNCVEDTFRSNNFIGNSFDISTNGRFSQNQFAGNYWDKYSGYDLDKNKIGDVPYRPVSLYSLVVEQVPPAIMFLRSFIVDLMDALEKVFPSFIPEQLLDERPVMHQFIYDHDKQSV